MKNIFDEQKYSQGDTEGLKITNVYSPILCFLEVCSVNGEKRLSHWRHDYPSILSACQAVPRVLCPVTVPTVQRRHGHAGVQNSTTKIIKGLVKVILQGSFQPDLFYDSMKSTTGQKMSIGMSVFSKESRTVQSGNFVDITL